MKQPNYTSDKKIFYPQEKQTKNNFFKKNFLLTFLLLFSFQFSFAQTKLTSQCVSEVSCSQKNGTTVIERDYTLTVIFDSKEIKFSTKDNPIEKVMNKYTITKKTDKYIIGINSEGNYCFFNTKNKQFYNIDYFMNRYLTAGYGYPPTEIKDNAEKMIQMLRENKTQKDVIQHLIEQSQYDF